MQFIHVFLCKVSTQVLITQILYPNSTSNSIIFHNVMIKKKNSFPLILILRQVSKISSALIQQIITPKKEGWNKSKMIYILVSSGTCHAHKSKLPQTALHTLNLVYHKSNKHLSNFFFLFCSDDRRFLSPR